MGCGSRAGKKEQHSNGKPHIDENSCVGCRRCFRECANNGLVFNAESKKMVVNQENCVGCGRCLGACNYDAIIFDNDAANSELNCRMAEYTKAVLDGRPHFHISLVVDVSPNCDCHGENDAPILPNIGMFASFDPLALDQACVDACMAATPMPGSQLYENIHHHDFVDHHDHFTNSTPESEWRTCLDHAEKIGLGQREYELVTMPNNKKTLNRLFSGLAFFDSLILQHSQLLGNFNVHFQNINSVLSEDSKDFSLCVIFNNFL
ncbi:MAG: DUF362 domain-containing protein, partial [Eubacterium sp.]